VTGAELAILVVDDHPVVRNGLSALLRTIAGFRVVGEVADGEAAVHAVAEHQPDVVLMDIRLPGIDGIEATRRIRESASDARVLVLTMYDDDATVFTAMQAGASGYPFPELTEREREILDLLADGKRTGAIAQQLFLSPKTVSNQLTSIFAKLQVAGRAEAIVRAREGGLGRRP
jgi:DNA-binding NarL/FixJ family response regulator